MKKLLLLLLCVPLIGFGQECKFLKNEVDDMTGEKTIITNGTLLCNKLFEPSLSIQPISINNSYYFAFSNRRMGEFNISQGNKVIIKLENDELITLIVKSSVSKLLLRSEVDKTMDQYDANFEADISLEQLTKLSKSKIQKIRIYYDEGAENLRAGMYYWEKDNFNVKKTDKFLKLINCLLEESKQ